MVVLQTAFSNLRENDLWPTRKCSSCYLNGASEGPDDIRAKMEEPSNHLMTPEVSIIL